MKDVDTEALIAKLSAEATQTPAHQPLRAPRWFIIPMLAVLAAYGLGVQFFLRIRADIALQLERTPFAAELLLLLAMFVAGTVASIFSMYPDQYQKPWVLKIPYGVTLVLAAFLLFQGMAMPYDPRMVVPVPGGHNAECALCIASVAILPAAFLFALMRRGASVTPLHAGCCAVLASSSLGCLTLRLAEANDSLGHLLLWHYVPTMLFSMIGAVLGQRLMRW